MSMAQDPSVPQSTEQDAPAATPAPTTDEIRAMVEAEAQRIVDARIPGLQSAYEKQLSQVRKELDKARKDPDGYDANTSDQYRADLEKAQREAAALRAGRSFPDAFPVYEAMMAADTVEDQLQMLQDFVRGTPAAEPEQSGSNPTPVPEAPTPSIDQNNPPSAPPPGGAGPATQDAAWQIIDQFKENWPKFGR